MLWFRAVWRNNILLGVMLPRKEGISLYKVQELKESEEFLHSYGIYPIRDGYGNIVGIEGITPKSPESFNETNAPEIIMLF